MRLFIYNAEDTRGEFSLFTNMLISKLMSKMLTLPDGKPDEQTRCFVVLDEFQTLSNGAEGAGRQTIRNCIDFLGLARSKKIATILATQSLARVERATSKVDVMALLQNTATHFYLSYAEPVGAKIITDIIGEHQKTTLKIGRNESSGGGFGMDSSRNGRSYSEDTRIENILLGSELANLPPMSAFLKISGQNLTRFSYGYTEHSTMTAAFVRRELGFFETDDVGKKLDKCSDDLTALV